MSIERQSSSRHSGVRFGAAASKPGFFGRAAFAIVGLLAAAVLLVPATAFGQTAVPTAGWHPGRHNRGATRSHADTRRPTWQARRSR